MSGALPTPFKITLALYGVVLAVNLALRQAVLGGVGDPRGLLGLGLLLLMAVLIWAAGLLVWLIVRRKRLSAGQLAVGWLLLGGAGIVLMVVAIFWGSIGV